MATRRLPNYLRMYRKRAGLTQSEVAFLLGAHDGAKVSRYERFARVPTLETALTYEAVFGVPTSELFAGIYEKVEGETVKRAKQFAQLLCQAEPNRRTAQKLQALGRLTSR